jgi:hypothetical protein
MKEAIQAYLKWYEDTLLESLKIKPGIIHTTKSVEAFLFYIMAKSSTSRCVARNGSTLTKIE